MPGVKVLPATRTGSVTPVTAPSATYFVPLVAERGAVGEPVAVTSMIAYERRFGGRTPYTTGYDSLDTFFAEGGERAYVVRVAGPAATAGTATLADGALAAALRVDAVGAGSWSGDVTVEVVAGSAPNSRKIIVTGPQGRETYDALVSNAAAAAALARSQYVRGTDLGGALVAEVAPTALSAGDDDRDALTGASFTDALELFAAELGDGLVAVPGQSADAVAQAVAAHCEATYRIGVVTAAEGASLNDAINLAGSIDSSYLALVWPWIIISDGAGGQRTASPEGFVAACRARAHRVSGPWRPPAGLHGAGTTLLGVAQTVRAGDADDADTARVSVIRTVAGNPRLYGWRSLSSDEASWGLLSSRDTINRLSFQAQQELEQHVFAPIDSAGRLYAAVEADLMALAEQVKAAGGLYAPTDDTGTQLDDGYTVSVGSDINTSDVAARNIVRAVLAVRVAPSGSLIEITIVRVGVTASL